MTAVLLTKIILFLKIFLMINHIINHYLLTPIFLLFLVIVTLC